MITKERNIYIEKLQYISCLCYNDLTDEELNVICKHAESIKKVIAKDELSKRKKPGYNGYAGIAGDLMVGVAGSHIKRDMHCKTYTGWGIGQLINHYKKTL